jgi:capsid assembly protease
MRLAQIYNILRNDPLLCDNDYRNTLLELFTEHAEMDRAEYKHKRTGRATSGSELDVEEAEVRDGIAIIPVGGPVAINLGEFEKGAGAVDLDDVTQELLEAEESTEVKAIIMNFDSPGGTVNGTWEMCDRIMAVEKPIYSFTRGLMCSAAYAMACATDGIFATKTARVGNIGVYCVHHDLTQMAARQGIAVKVFSSGPIKGAGVPGTPLTLDQQNFKQQEVMGLAKTFFDHVRARRGGIKDEDMGGQWYSGEVAGAKGFIDGLVNDIRELEAYLR